MQRELDDVRKARRDLLELVAQVDREIQESFDGAFRDVAVQFERLVKELFPGGEGRLVLTDPANPLEAGIEIEASPGRKRVKRISLLSGGERSLAALAFLFAIFTARPSPFYLMDEVEPALDDLNLHRFLRLVAGFARDAQVMIVTHQKRTMEIASMMYGVSLNKDGTTKILCQRLEHPDVPPDAERGPGQPRIRRRSWSRCQRASGSASVPGVEIFVAVLFVAVAVGVHLLPALHRTEGSRTAPRRTRGRDPRTDDRGAAPDPRERLGTRVRTLLSRGGAGRVAELHDLLLKADVGPSAAAQLVERVRARWSRDADAESLLRDEMVEILGPDARLALPDEGLGVILVVGVNGSGKTTTIGKLARRLAGEGRSVSIAGADTFRAAAGEQLEVWAVRAGAHLISQQRGADPGSVVFDAVKSSIAQGLGRPDRRHGRTAPYEDPADGRAAEDRAGGREGGRVGDRDPARPRCHHGAEWDRAGQSLHRGGGRVRDRADEARRDREGRGGARGA